MATITVRVDGTADPIGDNAAAVSSDQQGEQQTDPVLPPGGGGVGVGQTVEKTADDLNGAPLYVGDLAPSATWVATIIVRVDGTADPIGGNVAAVSSDQQGEQETNPVLPPGGGDVQYGIYLPMICRNR